MRKLVLKKILFNLRTNPTNWFVYLFLNNWIGKYENRKNIYRQNFLNVSSFFAFSIHSLYLHLTHSLFFCVICLFHFFVAWFFFLVQINIILLWWGFSLFVWKWNLNSDFFLIINFCIKSIDFFLFFWLMKARKIAVCSTIKHVYIFIFIIIEWMSVIQSLLSFFIIVMIDICIHFSYAVSRSLFCGVISLLLTIDINYLYS